jgi:hypothetical protein
MQSDIKVQRKRKWINKKVHQIVKVKWIKFNPTPTTCSICTTTEIQFLYSK